MGTLKDKIKAHTQKKAGRVARARENSEGRELIGRAKKLIDLLKPEYLDRAVQVWVDGLKATKDVYDARAKEWTTQPDWKERREAANMIVAYFEGRPIERQMVMKGSFRDLNDTLARMKQSPEAMRVLQELYPEELPTVQETGSEKPADVTREI
jgi:hypothetical protein